jgi:hypothetical protein
MQSMQQAKASISGSRFQQQGWVAELLLEEENCEIWYQWKDTHLDADAYAKHTTHLCVHHSHFLKWLSDMTRVSGRVGCTRVPSELGPKQLHTSPYMLKHFFE